jgi:hypothetical protein
MGIQRGGAQRAGVTGDEALAIALALALVSQQPSRDYTTVRVSGKGFGYLLPDGTRWIMVRPARVRHDELTELITEAWRLPRG